MLRKALSLVLLVAAALPGTAARADHGNTAISGTVSGVAGAPLQGICVYGEGEYDYLESLTAEDGSYQFGDFVPGDFVVYFSNCSDVRDDQGRAYLDEYYDDAVNYDDATRVNVGEAEHATGIDATLEVGGSITGTVTDPDGAPLEGICVEVVDPAYYYGSGGRTGADGTYVVDRLRSGSFKVHFTAGCDVIAVPLEPRERGSLPRPQERTTFSHGGDQPAWASEWYDDALDFTSAALVPVVVGVTTPAIDASLAPAAMIAGRVIGEDAELEYACVDVYSPSGDYIGGSWSEGNDFVVGGLRAAEYRLQMSDCYSGSYESEWFADKPTFSSADPVQVAEGSYVGGINGTLARLRQSDFAVQGLTVRPVPLQTDVTPVAPLGTLRDVTVNLENVGNLGGWTYVEVWAIADSTGERRFIGEDRVGLLAGGTADPTFRWNATGSFGDMTIEARVCGYDGDRRNDVGRTRSYALVGGTGQGFHTSRPFSGLPSDKECYDYVY